MFLNVFIRLLPACRLDDASARQGVWKLGRLELPRPDMSHICRGLLQLRRNLPSPWTDDEDRFATFGRHHLDRGHEISVVRYHDGRVKKVLPSVIQQMGREIHVGALFLHRMEFCD